ncbi:MAG: hypothetical protein ACK4ST_02610, partial [Elioraea tepidiphila]
MIAPAIAAVVALLALPVQAQTMRWATDRPLATLDPHATADPFTLGVLTNMHEGLVRRAPHPTDGRLALVSFTLRGRTVYARIVPLALETESEVLAGLSAAEERALRTGLARLLARIEDLD